MSLGPNPSWPAWPFLTGEKDTMQQNTIKETGVGLMDLS